MTAMIQRAGVIPERDGVTIGWRDGEKDVAVEAGERIPNERA
jgi:hypothetical protein